VADGSREFHSVQASGSRLVWMLPALFVIALVVWVADQTVGDVRQIWRRERQSQRRGRA
jgi:hypothetical protein